MGVRHSKEKTKQSKKFSSKRGRLKRASPDGESSQSRTEYKDNRQLYLYDDRKASPSQGCSMSKKSYSSLRVQLPAEKQTSCKTSSFKDETERPTSNWTLTFETTNKKLSHMMSSLHPHIESVHLDDSLGETRNIRVRLADSLEVDSFCKVGHSIEPQQISCGRICENANLEAIASSNMDRSKYYQEIPGMDESSSSRKLDTDSLSDVEKRIKPENKSSENRTRSCDRPCRGCGRSHSRSCHLSAKSSRFHSPFDQRSFQQAMMLRLTELQKKNASYARYLRSTFDSSESENENQQRTDSEYSGDDDNRVLGDSPQRNCARLFEPLPSRNIELKRRVSSEYWPEQNVQETYVKDHNHRVSASIDQPTSSAAKPWNKPVNHSGRKKTLSKKRPSGSKRHHGYLKASAAIQTGEVTFPNTPKASAKLVLNSAGVQRHQHEHIHHHYYYNCKTET